MAIEHLLGPSASRAGDVLVRELSNAAWTRLTAVVAFARMSGVRHVEKPLRDFVAAGGRVDLTLGVDILGTTYEAAWYLMNAVQARGRVLLASSEPGATFHPKVYIFSDASPGDTNAVRALRAASEVLAIVGSSNLTGGGLFVNDEASTVWSPDLSVSEDAASWESLIDDLEPWLGSGSTLVGRATATRLGALARAGRLSQELALASTRRRAPRTPRAGAGSRAAQRRPPRPPALIGAPPPPLRPPTPASPPGLSVLIARLSFGGSRRWPQWELNKDVLSTFFGVTVAGATIDREAVTRSGTRLPSETTPLVIGPNKNRRLEFPEPDHRPDPTPHAALLVVVDRRPNPFRYAVLFPGDAEYAAVEALNRSSTPVGQYVEATRRVVVPYAALAAVWPSCPL